MKKMTEFMNWWERLLFWCADEIDIGREELSKEHEVLGMGTDIITYVYSPEINQMVDDMLRDGMLERCGPDRHRLQMTPRGEIFLQGHKEAFEQHMNDIGKGHVLKVIEQTIKRAMEAEQEWI